jgi:hypothetical protein
MTPYPGSRWTRADKFRCPCLNRNPRAVFAATVANFAPLTAVLAVATALYARQYDSEFRTYKGKSRTFSSESRTFSSGLRTFQQRFTDLKSEKNVIGHPINLRESKRCHA